MLKTTVLTVLLIAGTASLATAAEPIKDADMCKARLETHKAMLAESDAGARTDEMVGNLLNVFSHLCATEAYKEALWVGDTIRGLLASEN